MSTFLAALTLVIALALLWAGIRRFSWSSPVSAALSGVELLGLMLAVYQLGWLGLGLFVAANVVGLLGWGAAGAIYVQQQVAAASALGGASRASIASVLRRLGAVDEMRGMGPRPRALLVRSLAERGRSVAEIEHMAVAIAVLWTIADKPDLPLLVDRLDSILRLYGKPAEEAMDVTDAIAVAAQRSASTVTELIEGSLVAAGGTIVTA